MFRFVPFVAFLMFSANAARAEKLDPNNPPKVATALEQKQGEDAAREFEKAKSTKLIDVTKPENAELLRKVNEMARKLGAASARSGIPYSVKIVESADVNAFTLPGGKIYLYRGLIDFTASDEEIAAVLAHEIGHNTRLHALRGQAKAKKLNLVSLAMMAAMIAGGQNGANLAQFSQLALIGVLNGYGIEYEKEADSVAIGMMTDAGYNPSALVTFMERLKLQEQRSPDLKLGIFQTHPTSAERAKSALADLGREGVAFTPRQVLLSDGVTAIEKPDRWVVSINDLTLVELAKTSSTKRAPNLAAQINALLGANLKAYELSATPQGALQARGQTLVVATNADAKLLKTTPAALAKKWEANFRRLFWREQINGKF